MGGFGNDSADDRRRRADARDTSRQPAADPEHRATREARDVFFLGLLDRAERGIRDGALYKGFTVKRLLAKLRRAVRDSPLNRWEG
ncbi:MAG: hypothetical protein AAF333_13155 [Planctomycetota bacterium]